MPFTDLANPLRMPAYILNSEPIWRLTLEAGTHFRWAEHTKTKDFCRCQVLNSKSLGWPSSILIARMLPFFISHAFRAMNKHLDTYLHMNIAYVV